MRTVLQKYIADSGYCSRRQAEDLIKKNKVLVNKERAELGMRVGEGDEVSVSGHKIGEKKENIYFALNKPRGYTCTNRKFPGEKNVFELVKTQERLFVVGRLDKDSQGLIILTNDGELAQHLTHPKNESEKKYLVEIEKLKNDPENIVKSFLKGIDLGREDKIVRAKRIDYIQNKTFEITLTEGRKRQIRRMFEKMGMKVVKLKRVSIGKLNLGELKEGKYIKITKEKIL